MTEGSSRGALTEKLANYGKRILQWLIVTAGAFAWCLGMLLLISVFLVNKWKVSYQTLLHWSAAAAAVFGIFYAVVIIRRELQG